MPLTLRAVSLNDQPITQPITASFGPQGGSIGRADTNTLALARPRAPHLAPPGRDRSPSGSGYRHQERRQRQSRSSFATSRSRSASRRRCAAAIRCASAAICSRSTSDDAAATIEPRVDAAGARPIDPVRCARSPPPPGRAVRRQALRRAGAPAFPPSSPFADLGAPVSAGNPFAELLGDSSPAAPRSPPSERHSPPPPEPLARRLRSVRAAARAGRAACAGRRRRAPAAPSRT